MTHAATHSNETMKRVDKFKQLLEIQENISGGPDLVSPTRQLVKQGKISKISARSGDHQERYLFLVSKISARSGDHQERYLFLVRSRRAAATTRIATSSWRVLRLQLTRRGDIVPESL